MPPTFQTDFKSPVGSVQNRGGTMTFGVNGLVIKGVQAEGDAGRQETIMPTGDYRGGKAAFAIDVMVSSDFNIGTSNWQTIDQLKNDSTGSPPLELMIGRGVFYFQGHNPSGGETWRHDVGKVIPGKVHHLAWEMTFSGGGAVLSAVLDGNQSLTNVPIGPTLYPGQSDYWKCGLYRDGNLGGGTITFKGAQAGATLADVSGPITGSTAVGDGGSGSSGTPVGGPGDGHSGGAGVPGKAGGSAGAGVPGGGSVPGGDVSDNQSEGWRVMSDPVAWGMDAAADVSVATLRKEGASFICCYLAPYPSQGWKMRTPAQVREYVAAGIDVVFNWESDGTPGSGFSTGINAARTAQSELNDRGFPNAPVIFTFADSENPDRTALYNAIAGAVSVLGHDRVGAYGSADIVDFLAAHDACRYYWQTYAWSHGRRSNHAQLYQRKNTATYDYDVAYARDFGQATLNRSATNTAPTKGTPVDVNGAIVDYYKNDGSTMSPEVALGWAAAHAGTATDAANRAVQAVKDLTDKLTAAGVLK